MWGLSLTPADVNNLSFGLVGQFQHDDPSSGDPAKTYMDAYQINVHYTDAPIVPDCDPSACWEMWVSHTDGNAIRRFNQSGGHIGNLTTTTYATPKGMALGPDGNLYVADQNSNRIIKYHGTTGAYITDFITSGIGNPVKLSFGPDGNLYVIDDYSTGGIDKVIKFNGSTGTYISDFIVGGSSDIYRDLLFSLDGSYLYIAENNGHRILKYNGSTGVYLGVAFDLGSQSVFKPNLMAWGPDGSMYVASEHISTTAIYRGTVGSGTVSYYANPTGGPYDDLAFSPACELYVATRNGHSILKLVGSSNPTVTVVHNGDNVNGNGSGLLHHSGDIIFNENACNTCDNVTSSGQIGYEQSGCEGFDPAEIVSVSLPSGGSGALEYVWLESTNGGSSYSVISGANGSSYNPGPVSQTTWYRRCARRTGCTSYVGESNWVQITVDDCIAPPSSPICQSGDYLWTNDIDVNNLQGSNGIPQADVRFVDGGNLVLPGPYPAVFDGPVTISIDDVVSWDAYTTRASTGNQPYETWRVIIKNNGSIVYTSPWTGDLATGVKSAEWRGSLGSVYLADGLDEIIIAHSEDGTYGNGSLSSPNSVVPVSVCISGVPACSNVTNAGQIGYAQSGCEGFDPDEIVSVSLPSGGSGALEYVWLQSYNGGSSATIISGATGSSYNPGPVSQTTWYRRCARRAGCTSYVGESNWIEVTVTGPCCDNVTNPGSIAANQSNCGPFDPVLLSSTSAPSGGSGALEIVWITRPGTSGSWTTVAGATGLTYDPPTVSQTTQYRRCARRAGCTDYIGESNIITITVTPGITLNCSATNGTCNNNNIGTATATASGGTAPYTYVWNTGWSNQTMNAGPGTYNVVVTDANGCTADCSVTITGITCCNVTDPGVIGSNQSGCNPHDADVIENITSPSGGVGSLEYVWLISYNGGSSYSVIPGANGASYDPGTVTQTTWYRRCARRSGCTSYVGESNWVQITVQGDCCSMIVDAGQDQSTCGDAVTLTANVSDQAECQGPCTTVNANYNVALDIWNYDTYGYICGEYSSSTTYGPYSDIVSFNDPIGNSNKRITSIDVQFNIAACNGSASQNATSYPIELNGHIIGYYNPTELPCQLYVFKPKQTRDSQS